MAINVQVLGAEEIIKALTNKDILSNVNKELSKLAIKMANRAKKATVVDTGRLRASIATQMLDLSAEIGTNVEYAPFVEFGTSKMEARHLEGSSKVLGEGMFTFTVNNSQEDIDKFSDEMGKIMSDRWPK
ncbi:HK97-gp10 family putative phage morphogenesis protein [Dehalococcoides sp. THU3]|uniref:HK97-gp10 family putative phage morphogenesis protein n=1 Tax=Dehalococcoides TaxID=61434 RepID=UPI0032188E2C